MIIVRQHFYFQFQWVNETLDDEEETNRASGNTEQDKNGAFNPLDDPMDQCEETNPLGDDESDKPVEAEPVTSVTEEEALLETVTAATEQPPFINECQEDATHENSNIKDSTPVIEGDNPLGDIDDFVNDNVDSEKVPETSTNIDPFSDNTAGPSETHKTPAPALTDEDLLTGPAHNLDDSQYKADFVDPSLEDIFK